MKGHKARWKARNKRRFEADRLKQEKDRKRGQSYRKTGAQVISRVSTYKPSLQQFSKIIAERERREKTLINDPWSTQHVPKKLVGDLPQNGQPVSFFAGIKRWIQKVVA